MSLEDFESNFESSAEGADGGKESGVQAVQERIEKYQQKKEKSSKAIAGIQRTQKDEKKARRDDAILARIIEYFLKDGQYSTIVDVIIPVIDNGYASNLIIGMISLIFTPAARMIREYFSHPSEHKELMVLAGSERFSIQSTTGLFTGAAFDDTIKQEELTDFDDNNLPIAIRDRINKWVEDIGVVVSSDPSTILTQRVIELMDTGETKMTIEAMTQILSFFFKKLNIRISDGKARSYATFILSQLKIRLEELSLEEV